MSLLSFTKKLCISVLSVVTLVSLAHAQTAAAPQMMSEVISTVNLRNVRLVSQNGNTFNISFDISNRIGVQPDVHYGISLAKVSNTTSRTVDEHVYGESLVLNEGVLIHKDITYQAPETLSGTYSLRILLKSSRGVPYAGKVIGNVTLAEPKTGSVYIDPSTCTIVTSGTNEKHTPSDFFLVNKGSSLSLTCTLKSSLKTGTVLTPVVAQHIRDAYGDAVANDAKLATVSIAQNESKKVTIEVPSVTTPSPYYAAVWFTYGTASETNKVMFRYYVEGIGGSIRTLLLDKDGYMQGDTARVSFLWTPYDSTFSNIIDGSKQLGAALISLVNGNNATCAQAVTQTLTTNDHLITVPIAITSDCQNPQIKLSIMDPSQKVFDSQHFSIITSEAKVSEVTTPLATNSSSESAKNHFMIAGVFALIAMLCFLFRKQLVGNAMKSIIVLLLGISFMSGVRSAHADGVVLWYVGPPAFPIPAATNIFFNSHLDKASYVPGGLITVNYYAFSDDNPQPSSGSNICLKAWGWVDSGPHGPDAFPSCYTPQNLRDGFWMSAPAGNAGAVSGWVHKAYGSNRYNTALGSGAYTVKPPCSLGDTELSSDICPATCSSPANLLSVDASGDGPPVNREWYQSDDVTCNNKLCGTTVVRYRTVAQMNALPECTVSPNVYIHFTP